MYEGGRVCMYVDKSAVVLEKKEDRFHMRITSGLKKICFIIFSYLTNPSESNYHAFIWLLLYLMESSFNIIKINFAFILPFYNINVSIKYTVFLKKKN